MLFLVGVTVGGVWVFWSFFSSFVVVVGTAGGDDDNDLVSLILLLFLFWFVSVVDSIVGCFTVPLGMLLLVGVMVGGVWVFLRSFFSSFVVVVADDVVDEKNQLLTDMLLLLLLLLLLLWFGTVLDAIVGGFTVPLGMLLLVGMLLDGVCVFLRSFFSFAVVIVGAAGGDNDDDEKN